MVVQQSTIWIKPISTDTKPSLYELTLIAKGNLAEIEWLTRQLEKIKGLDKEVTK